MVNDKTPKVYLSRRNLLALLSKLDRDSAGDASYCSIMKYKNAVPQYQQTMTEVMISAVEDDEYYGALERSPGEIHPNDEARTSGVETAIQYPDPLL